MTITKFEKSIFETLRPVITKALQKAVEQFGLQVEVGGIKYSDTSFTAKVEISTANNAESEFRRYAAMFNLKPEWFGQQFVYKGATYRVIGIEAGRSKFPVRIQDVATGERSTFKADGLRNLLGGDEEKAKVAADQKANFRMEYEIYGSGLGLRKAWLGQPFHMPSASYTIVGLEQKRTKSHVILEKVGGGLSWMPVDSFLFSVNNDPKNAALKAAATATKVIPIPTAAAIIKPVQNLPVIPSVEFPGKPTEAQQDEYRERIRAITTELNNAGMMPSEGIGGPAAKLKRFAELNAAKPTAQMTVDDWGDLFATLDGFIERNSWKHLVKYIDDSLGVKN